MTILIVDGNRGFLYKAAEALSKQNIAVTIVLKENAADAVRFALNHPVDIVYAREETLEMSWTELIRKIKRYQPLTEGYLLQRDEVPQVGVVHGLV